MNAQHIHPKAQCLNNGNALRKWTGDAVHSYQEKVTTSKDDAPQETFNNDDHYESAKQYFDGNIDSLVSKVDSTATTESYSCESSSEDFGQKEDWEKTKEKDDPTVRLWNELTGEETRILWRHARILYSLSYYKESIDFQTWMEVAGLHPLADISPVLRDQRYGNVKNISQIQHYLKMGDYSTRDPQGRKRPSSHISCTKNPIQEPEAKRPRLFNRSAWQLQSSRSKEGRSRPRNTLSLQRGYRAPIARHKSPERKVTTIITSPDETWGTHESGNSPGLNERPNSISGKFKAPRLLVTASKGSTSLPVVHNARSFKRLKEGMESPTTKSEGFKTNNNSPVAKFYPVNNQNGFSGTHINFYNDPTPSQDEVGL